VAYTWYWRERSPLHVSLSGGALTLSFAGKVNLSFDGEGRLVSVWFDGLTFRRSLDNRLLAKWTEQRGRYRRFLSLLGRSLIFERAYSLVADVTDALDADRIATGSTSDNVVSEVHRWLRRIGEWNNQRLERERARFYQVYKPVPVLPPDQYLSVVLQATEGCSYNRCSFCTFYRHRPFRIKTLLEFKAHIEAVKSFLGRGLQMRRSLFLADANAVVISQRHLLPTLDVINRAFCILPQGLSPGERRRWVREHPHHLKGIYSFISAPDALRKTSSDFRAMKERNVNRLYVGLETGYDPLRQFVRKQGTASDVAAAVRVMKAGGMQVGIIFMVGIGGQTFREQHFQHTVKLITELPLAKNDLIYISPFVPSADAPYVYEAAERGIPPLNEHELAQEAQRFRRALMPWAHKRGVRISHYDIREMLY